MNVLILGSAAESRIARMRLEGAGFGVADLDSLVSGVSARPDAAVAIGDSGTGAQAINLGVPCSVIVMGFHAPSPEQDELLGRIRRALSGGDAASSSVAAEVVGESEAMRLLAAQTRQLATRTRVPALFVGEVGTGRRHWAQLLHRWTFPSGEFIAIRPGQAAAQLAALLDPRRARADALNGTGVTLFVPDSSLLPRDAQLTLAALLQDRSPRPLRLVLGTAQTHRARAELDLIPELKHQLAFELQIPALREHACDVPDLTRAFADQLCLRLGLQPVTFTDGAMQALSTHDWPGNVAELRSTIERVVALAAKPVIDAGDLPVFATGTSGKYRFQLPASGINLDELERDALTQALQLTKNRRGAAAALLGITRDQLRYRMAKFGIDAPTTTKSDRAPDSSS